MDKPDPESKDAVLVASDEARKGLAEILARAGYKDERFIITLYGRAHAALIGMKDFERLRQYDEAAQPAA